MVFWITVVSTWLAVLGVRELCAVEATSPDEGVVQRAAGGDSQGSENASGGEASEDRRPESPSREDNSKEDSKHNSSGSTPAATVERIILGLRRLRAATADVTSLLADLQSLSGRLRSELTAVRAERGQAQAELAKLEGRLRDAEARERELIARVEAVDVVLALLRRDASLPDPRMVSLLLGLGDTEATGERRFSLSQRARSGDLFRRQVWPLFERSCHRCHGESRPKGELRLLSRVDLLRGGLHGAALVPGDANASRLFRLAAHLDEPHMPPGKKKLEPREVEAIREWVVTGASWEPEPPSGPAVREF